MAMGGIVQLVLHHFEKSHRLGAFGVIVHASSVEVEDLTVHHLFGGTDVPDAVKKLLPIAAAAEILQALIIHGEARSTLRFPSRRTCRNFRQVELSSSSPSE